MTTFVIPPAGTPASTFSPSTFADPAQPPGILADDIDVATGEIRGLLSSIHPVDGAVLHILRTQLGSGAVATVGTTFHEVKKNLDGTAADLRFRTLAAFKLLTDRGDIRIDSVAAETADDFGGVFMTYTNLRTLEPNKVQIA